MSAKASYFKIGVFTIVGVTLIVVFIVALGAGELFKKKVYVETYFNESVQGLTVGAPVKVRGVQIGTVDEIDFCGNKYPTEEVPQLDKGYSSYVYVRISFTPASGRSVRRSREERQENLERLAKEGFRVRLASQGITGLLYLEADFLDVESLPPPLEFVWTPEFVYVPSAPSTMSRLSDSLVGILGSLRKVEFDTIGKDLDELLVVVNKAVKELRVGEVTDNIEGVLKRIRDLLEKPELDNLSVDAGQIVSDVRALTGDLKPRLESLGEKLDSTFTGVESVVKEVEATLKKPEMRESLEQLPGVVSQLKLALKRTNTLIASSQDDVGLILSNLKMILEQVKELTSNARKYPSQVILGEPPKPTVTEEGS